MVLEVEASRGQLGRRDGPEPACLPSDRSTRSFLRGRDHLPADWLSDLLSRPRPVGGRGGRKEARRGPAGEGEGWYG